MKGITKGSTTEKKLRNSRNEDCLSFSPFRQAGSIGRSDTTHADSHDGDDERDHHIQLLVTERFQRTLESPCRRHVLCMLRLGTYMYYIAATKHGSLFQGIVIRAFLTRGASKGCSGSGLDLHHTLLVWSMLWRKPLTWSSSGQFLRQSLLYRRLPWRTSCTYRPLVTSLRYRRPDNSLELPTTLPKVLSR